MIALETYDKLIDFESRREFWFNTKSQAAIWTKPRALSWHDVGNPVLMPGRDLLFDIKCPQCNKYSIEGYCVQCDNLYCDGCYAVAHGENTHTRVVVDSCIQCRFQIGTHPNSKSPREESQVQSTVNNAKTIFVTRASRTNTRKVRFKSTHLRRRCPIARIAESSRLGKQEVP